MKSALVNLTVEVELQPGERLELPDTLLASMGAGRWRITIQPLTTESQAPVRDHSAFLRSYDSQDEGLYDDYPVR